MYHNTYNNTGPEGQVTSCSPRRTPRVQRGGRETREGLIQTGGCHEHLLPAAHQHAEEWRPGAEGSGSRRWREEEESIHGPTAEYSPMA